MKMSGSKTGLFILFSVLFLSQVSKAADYCIGKLEGGDPAYYTSVKCDDGTQIPMKRKLCFFNGCVRKILSEMSTVMKKRGYEEMGDFFTSDKTPKKSVLFQKTSTIQGNQTPSYCLAYGFNEARRNTLDYTISCGGMRLTRLEHADPSGTYGIVEYMKRDQYDLVKRIPPEKGGPVSGVMIFKRR